MFLIFPVHGQTGPKWHDKRSGDFVPTNTDLATILGDVYFNLTIVFFNMFLDPLDLPYSWRINILCMFAFFGWWSMGRIVWYGMKWGQAVFLLTNPDLATILGDMYFNFENVYF